MTSNNIRAENSFPSNLYINSNSSLNISSKISDFTDKSNNGIINSFDEITKNQDKDNSYFNLLQKKTQREEKNIENQENNKKTKIINLTNVNTKYIWLKFHEKDLCLCKINKNTKIKEIIEKYIKSENINERTNYNCYYDNKIIEDLDKFFDDLKIGTIKTVEIKCIN